MPRLPRGAAPRFHHKESAMSEPKIQFPDFKEAYRAAYRCQPENFDQQIFWKCVHRRALPTGCRDERQALSGTGRPFTRWPRSGPFQERPPLRPIADHLTMAHQDPRPLCRNFREAFCHRHGCDAARFGRNVFFRAVPPTRLPLVLLFWIFDREMFAVDLDIIRMLGDTVTQDDCTALMDELNNANRFARTFLRGTLGVRASGGRLMALRDSLDSLIETTGH